MENSKVNSQDFVAGAVGRNDDVFSAINFPDSHIFSLQRFAEGDENDGEETTDDKKVILRQTTGTTTLLADSLLGGILTPFTLGRSSDTTLLTAEAGKSGKSITVDDHSFFIAPLVHQSGTTTVDVYDSSYKLTSYKVDDSLTRIAVQYDGLPVHSDTQNNGWFAYVGFAVSDTSSLDLRFSTAQFNGNQYNTAEHANTYSGTYLNDTVYTSAYVTVSENTQGGKWNWVASTTGKTYSFDIYDVNVSAASGTTTNLITDKYVFRDKTGTKDIDFGSQQTLSFDNIDNGESETYKLNGVGVTFTGLGKDSTTNVAGLTVEDYKGSATAQTFAFTDDFNSNVSIAFTLDGLGSNTGVSLDGVTYKSSTNSGTVMFSASGTTEFITLGNGGFALDSVATDGTIYNLANGASGTFTFGTTGDGAFILDVDGTGTAFAPVTFSSTGNASTIIAHYGDSNITLGGTFSLAGDSVTALAYSFSETAQAQIGGYTFTDISDGKLATLVFDGASAMTVGNAMKVGFGEDAASTATINDISFLANSGEGYAQFNGSTNTLTISSGLTVTDSNAADKTFTLADVGNDTINNFAFNVKIAGTGTANQLTFIDSTVSVASNFSALDTSSFVASVTGYNAGDNIGVATGTAITIDAQSATLLGKYYFSTGEDANASGTVTFSDTTGAFGLTGNLIVTGASGTQLVGLNGESFTASAGSFFIGETGTIAVNSFTFTDASDGYVSELIYNGAGNSITLAGAMTASGTFSNEVFTLANVGSYTINADTFVATKDGNADANQISFIQTTLTTDTTHIFEFDNLEVNGFDAGSNITVAGSTTVAANTAKLIGGYYFGAGTDSGSVVFNSASEITLIGTGLVVDAVGAGTDSNTLFGVSETTFNATGGTFYLADGGSNTSINGLKFNEVDNDSITKLVYTASTSEMGVFGSVVLTGGSETQMTYSLGSDQKLADVSAISINGIEYAGTGVSVFTSSTNTFVLGAGENALMTITGSNTALTYTLSDTSMGAFQFGGITIGSSGTGLGGAVAVEAFGNLVSNSSLSQLNIGGALVQITDAPGSSTYRIDLVGDSMSGATISQIDNGAYIYKVASATNVVTTGNGTFTFSTTALVGADGTSTQIFSITGDDNGVTFGLNESGMVVSISGIANNAVIGISDLTMAGTTKKQYSRQVVDGEWHRLENGAWDTDKYLGYLVGYGDSKFNVTGIESTTYQAHVPMSNYTTVGKSDTGLFTLYNSVFDSSTQVIFQNDGDTGYAAKLSGTSVTTLFSDLKMTGAELGVMYESGTDKLQLASVPKSAGTATALTSISGINSEISLALADYALDVYTGYNVSGTGVGVAVSNTVKVSANGGTAVVGMPDNNYITFGQSSGTYVLNGITTNTLFVDAIAAGSTAVGTNTDIFAISLAGGAILSDTFTSSASELSINDITYSLVGTSSTFVYTTASDASDTLAVNAGFLTADDLASNSAIFNSVKYEAASNTGLYFGAYSYTGISEATAAFSLTQDESGTQVADVTGGVLQESVASDSKFQFVYNGASNTYTANGLVTFNLDATTNTFVSGTGTRVLGTDSIFTLVGGSNSELVNTTFTFSSGSVALTFNDSEKYKAKENISAGEGVFTGTSFMMSDYYLRDGDNDTRSDTKVYTYTVNTGDTATITWTIDATNGIGASNTMTLSTGFGATRQSTDTSFVFGDTYTRVSDDLTFFLSKESATDIGAAGVIYTGIGTRTYVAGTTTPAEGVETATTWFRTFDSDQYSPSDGAVLTLTLNQGVGSETFTMGSGTFTTESGEFHFNGNAYTATSAVTLGAYFTADSTTGLFSASGAGTREGSGTYVLGTSLQSDTYTFDNASLLLNFDAYDTLAEVKDVVNSGTGIYSGTGISFTLNDNWLAGGPTGSEAFVYKTADEAILTLTLTDSATGTVEITKGLGTRTATVVAGTTTFNYLGKEYTAMTNSTVNSTFTYAIGGSGTTLEAAYNVDSATGVVYTGAGYRAFVSGTDVINTVLEFNSDTYTFTGGQLNMNLDAGSATFSAGAGTATYEAVAYTEALATAGSNTTFHFTLNGATNLYTATAVTTLVGQVDSTGSITALLSATGSGTRLLGAGEIFAPYTVTALGDAYTMQESSTLELSIGGVTAAGVGFGTETFIAGTGTYANAATFTLNDKWLAGGPETGDTTYTYTAVAGSEATLALTLTGRDSGTIEITSGFGTRTSELTLGNTFNYAGDIYTATQTAATFGIGYYTNADGVNYNVATATGMLYSGAGVRDFNSASDTNKLSSLEFNSDTNYTFIGGQLNLTLTTGTAVYSAGAGSATYTAAANTGVFHFGANAYNATTETVLYGIVDENGSVTGLYNATGAGTREGSGTYVVMSIDSFTMANDATLTIDFSKDGINASETYTNGTGYMTATGTVFAINEYYFTGGTGTKTAEGLTYTAVEGSETVLSLNLVNGTETVAVVSGMGVRTDTTTTDFVFDNNTYTKVANTSLLYSLDKDAETYEGALYSAVGTRDFQVGSDTFQVTYLTDTYDATAGVLQLTLANGASETLVTGGSATYAANAGDTFHFTVESGTFEYKATTNTSLSISFNIGDGGTTSTLFEASGAGTRDITSATTFALSALNNDSYTFAAGATALLSISDVSTYNETAYAGDGVYSATSTFYAAFGEGNAYDSSTAFTYTASGTAVLNVTLANGEVETQKIVDGMGFRTDASTSTTFNYTSPIKGTEYTYSATSAAGTETPNLTFKLDSSSKNAFGDFYSGVGYRNGASDTYTPDGSEQYTLDGAAEWQLTVADGANASETLYTANTTNDFASGTTFAFKGTTYTVDTTTAVLSLTATKGDVTEMLTAGSAVFEGTSSDTKFTYDTNEYNVVGSATLRLVVNKPEPEFVSGKGQKEMSSSATGTLKTFKYTDGNTYTVTSDYARLVAVGNGTKADVNFETGTAVDSLTKDQTFYYALDHSTNTLLYTANEGGATLGITGTTSATAYAEFIGGSGNRIETGVALGTTFTFDGNTYNSTSDTFTWTLSLSDTKAVENVTGAEGSRTVLGGTTFTYISPTDNATHTYTVQSGSDVSLAISLVDGNATETMTEGAATRDMASGTTFNFAPDALFNQSATFTATAAGTYQLKANGTATNGMETLGQTEYNGNSVTETILGVTATGTYTDFAYKSIVTNESETYTSPGGVNFTLTITGDTNTVTWDSGSATMALTADKEIYYQQTAHSYTALTGATFTRVSENDEYFTSGDVFRALDSGSDVFNVTYLSDTYTADAGRINLNASGTAAYESFNSGTAAFALTVGGNNFHFDFNGKTNEYTVTESGTLQVNVENGSATTLFAASGAGTRAQNASDVAMVDILTDIYNVSSGTYQLSLGTAAVGDESETLIGGAGVFTTTSQFHVSDFYLGNGTDTTSYEYTALNGSEVQLALTINGADSQTIKLTSGIGTRDYTSETFTFNVGGTDYNYTASGTIVNAISADSRTSAAGYIYKAVGTREGADTNTTFYFREDLYTAQSGTMQLTVTKGVGVEDMISGTATYVAGSGAAFHYDYNKEGVRAYTATTQTTLTTTFTDGTSTAKFASIVGEGTRTASETDVANFSYVFESDTYKAIAGSATIKLDATTANIFETLSAGSVIDEVAVGNEFHYNGYAYNAQSATTIEHTIGETTKNFTADPYATRQASDTTFSINLQTYNLDEGASETFLLTGTGTTLTENLLSASGYRQTNEGESYTSLWNNTYSLSSGTYTIAVTGGAGTETLTTASAELAVNAGLSVNYGDSSTSYTANIDGATLNFNVANAAETETLTAGAIYNSSGTYLIANGNFTVGTAGNATLTAPTADSSTLVTVTAGDAITAASASLVGAFASGNFLNVNDKVIAADSAATLNIFDVSNVAAAIGSFSAQGDFTGGNFLIDSGTVQVEADTDITVSFDTSAITAINNLTDGVTVKDAAGATKAYTDSTGTFKFDNTAAQKFNISTDNEVTFQIDSNGIVTGIAGLNYDGTAIDIVITDTNVEYSITVTDTGIALSRDSETGAWKSGDVVAVAYVVEVATDSTVLVSAIDENSNTTQIDSSKLGTYTTANGAIAFSINSTVDVTETPVYVENSATDTVVNVTNYVTGIGNTADDMAVRIDSTESGVVNVYKASAASFDSVKGYTIGNGTFSVGTAGEITLAAASSALASVTTADTAVSLKAETTARTFAVNDSDAQVTLAVGDADTNGVGYYGLQLENSELTGLKPNDVETGTVVIASSKDADTTTTFKINDDTSVSVTNDNDSDGITLEIESDTLKGISNVSTDATISASGADKLVIDGDSDNAVAVTTDTIRYNTTDKKWISGDAPAKVATGYLVTVDSSGTVHLAYTDATHTDTTVTTNKLDYAAAFDNLSLDQDGGTLPTYGGAIEVNSGLGNTVGVSVATAYGEGVNITDSTDTKALTLVTANGNFSVNGQQIIPSAAANVTAISGGAQVALTSDTTITHDGMNFTAGSDTSATFTSSLIALNNTTKVTNTDSNAQFNVKGTVTFDGIAVVGGDSTSVTNVETNSVPSGLSVNEKDLIVTGGDRNYTVDASTDTVVISGITSAATVEGALVAGAVVQTDSTGTYKIGASNDFTITGDSAVDFAVNNDSLVTGISGVGSDTVTGSVIGNFTSSITINGKTVLVSGDELVSVSANGTQVTQIDGVGAASNEETVSVANAGGATLVNTDATGNFYFGDGSTNSQFFVVGNDAQVGFTTSSLANDVPSVTGITSFEEGTLEIAQSVTAFTVNNENAINLANDNANEHVTLSVASITITSVNGLTGSVSGLNTGVAVEVIESDVSINGAQLSVNEVESLNVVANAVSGTGYDVVTGLNNNATVNVAKNVSVKTEEAGVFTFVDDVFTITGDPSVTFETDGNSRVKNVADFAGTLTSTESDVTVNGAAISMTNTDASITAAAGNVTVSGLADGDAVTVPTGAVVEMPGTTSTNTDTAITVNGKPYTLEGDGDGVAITAGTPNDTVDGLDAGARLTVGSAGSYNVNGSELTASIGAVIVGDAEGAAHVYSDEDINFDSDTNTDDIINKIVNGGDTVAESTDKYVEHVTDTSKAASMLAEGGSALDGNLDMVIGDSDTKDAQTADFSNNKGIKKVTMSGNNAQDVKFNDEGGNVAVVGSGVEGEKNVALGNGGDLAVVEKTDTPVNITAGRGRDTVVTQGRNVKVNISAGGPTRLMATAGNLDVTGYDHKTGAGVQLTNSDVARAVQRNAIQLANGSVGVNGATVNLNTGDDAVGSSIVNFYNLKGKMTKVGFTHSSGGTVDLSSEKSDVVLKGNYSGANDQDDSARASKKDGGSILVGGSGNDSAFGGAGDRLNMGNGDNYVAIDNKRTNTDVGATIEQTATQGRTVVEGFNNNDFSDMGDRIRISVSASVKFVNGVLTFALGAASLILKGVTSAVAASSRDLAESADIVNNDYSFARTMIENADGSLIKAAVAEEGKWIQVTSANAEDYLANAYLGTNSGIDFASYDGTVNLVLADGETDGRGNIGGTEVNVRGITKIQLGSNDSTVIGAANTNNTIAAGTGNASMWGGGASNDTLIGNTVHSGSTDFFYFDGNGRDFIQDFEFLNSENHATADRINILNSNLCNAVASGNDLVIEFSNNEDRLTVKDGIGKDIVIERGVFGSRYNSVVAQVNTNMLNYDGQANYFFATGKNATVSVSSDLYNAEINIGDGNSFAGDIKVLAANGVQGNTTLIGNANDNTIFGSAENSSMWGGTGGNDTLVGGDGVNTFFYGKGNGNDVAVNVDGNDIVNLYNINIDDLVITTETAGEMIDSNSVTVTLKDGGSLTVQTSNNDTAFKLQNGQTYLANHQNRTWSVK